MGKSILAKVNKYYLVPVTLIQLILAIVLGTKTCINREATYLNLLLMMVLIGFACFLVFKRNKVWLLVALYIFTLPIVFDASICSENIMCLPGKPRGTMNELMMQRFVWPHISEMGYTYGLDLLDDNQYIELAVSPETLWTDFFPAIKGYFGIYSPEIYKRYFSISMGSMKRSVIPELITDCGKYVFSPVSAELALLGKIGNANGDDFERVIDRMGNIGRFYYHFGFAGFVGLVLIGIANRIVYKEKAKVKVKVNLAVASLISLFTLYSVFFPLRGYDYKKAVWITVIYCLYICFGLRRLNADN